MHRQDGRQELDRRTLLDKGAAFAALLVTGCARKESRGFAATSLRQLRARLERHIEPGFAPGMAGRMLYSLLNAIAGSTRVARTAGIPHAAIATTTSVATARSEEMSNVPTP